jgi:DNA-binding MarR family transcriptional regulator
MNSLPDEQSQSNVLVLAGELRAVIGKLGRRLREQGNLGDFTSSQVSVLGRLYRDGPATVSSLARSEGMRQQSMGSIISSLQEGGYITGTPDPNDGRQTILSLTEVSRERIRASRVLREDWLVRGIQAHISPTEQKALSKAVEYLQRLAEANSQEIRL